MYSSDIINIGSFGISEDGPNWFDWLSLFASLVGALIGAYFGWWSAKRIFNKQLDGVEQQIKDNHNIFLMHLSDFKEVLKLQKEKLVSYRDNGLNSFSIIPEISTTFISNFDVKTFYNFVYKNDIEKKKLLTELNLSSGDLSGLINLITSEIVRHKQERNMILQKFHFNDLIGYQYFNIINSRVTFITVENSKMGFRFNEVDDDFTRKYFDLHELFLKKIGSNQTVSFEDISHQAVNEFIKPLLSLSKEYTPQSFDAIRVNHLASESINAYVNYNKCIEYHTNFINSCINTLDNIEDKIERLLK